MMFRMIGMVILSMHSVNCEFRLFLQTKLMVVESFLLQKSVTPVVQADTFL